MFTPVLVLGEEVFRFQVGLEHFEDIVIIDLVNFIPDSELEVQELLHSVAGIVAGLTLDIIGDLALE